LLLFRIIQKKIASPHGEQVVFKPLPLRNICGVHNSKENSKRLDAVAAPPAHTPPRHNSKENSKVEDYEISLTGLIGGPHNSKENSKLDMA